MLARTLKQQIYQLVDDLPEDLPLLAEVAETLRLNQGIGEALEDVRAGRTFEADEFTKRVEDRWPRKTTCKFRGKCVNGSRGNRRVLGISRRARARRAIRT